MVGGAMTFYLVAKAQAGMIAGASSSLASAASPHVGSSSCMLVLTFSY